VKNKQPTPKSTTTHIAALSLVLAAFCLPTAQLQAQGRGSPPTPVDFTQTLSGFCSFDIFAQVTGKTGVISLPDGGFIFTAPATRVTRTNLSDTTKSVTLSLTGSAEIGPVQNGTITEIFRGRNVVAFGPFAPSPNQLLFLIGTWTVVIDANTGHVLQGPTGNGQMTDVCGLLD